MTTRHVKTRDEPQSGEGRGDSLARATRKRSNPAAPTPSDTAITRPSETTPGSLESPIWQPSTAQLRYLLALETAIEANEPYSDRALAAKLKISRQTIYEWKHDDRFRTWYKTEFNQTSDDNWPLIIRKHEMQTMRGSVKSAEFLARVRYLDAKLAGERLRPGESIDGADPRTDYKVIVLVPQPPALDGEMLRGGGSSQCGEWSSAS
jgi:hypothetical protein